MSYGRYIRLPVTIEAMRYFKSLNKVEELLTFCNRSEKTASYVIPHGQLDFGSGSLSLRTFAGTVWIKPGDWVIRDADGQYHTCDHETFRSTYMETSDG